MRCIFFLLLACCLISCKDENVNSCYDTECFSDEYCLDGRCIKINEEQLLSFKNQPVPSKITISNLIVTRYNDMKSAGVPYDVGSRPDIFIIATQSSTRIYDFPTIQDASSPPLNIPLPAPFVITNVSQPLVFNLYDDDGNMTDEFMGGVIFSIFNRQGTYPERISVGNSAVGLAFDVDYEF